MAHSTQHLQQNSGSYRAYLVRLWQEDEEGVWRASAQAVQSGEVVRFASLQALYAFLRANTEAARPARSSGQRHAEDDTNEDGEQIR